MNLPKLASEMAHKPAAFVARLASDFTVLLRLSDLVECTLEALDKEVGFECCTIGLLEEYETSILTLIGASGPCRDLSGSTISRGASVYWAVLDAGRPLYVPDTRIEPHVSRGAGGACSGIYAPLTVQGRVIGVLSAHRRGADAFPAADLEVLTAVAGYLAGACEVARRSEQCRALAVTDPLTGLMNRRAFFGQAEAEMSLSRRTGRPFTLAMLDLDGFKVVNDMHGHATGDTALIRVAEVLRRCTRTYDRVVRWGGDEFVLLLPATTAAQAHRLLERVRNIALSLGGVPADTQLTVSWGVASWPVDGDSHEILVGVADARLYAMKRSTVSSPTPSCDGHDPPNIVGTNGTRYT